ncbi:MAG TPA: MaoC family dehydratase N-terminal domain-containing protein [Pseudonocardiaceae bacterium]
MGDETYGEPFTVEVERGKIREFARATKARDPRYLEDPRPVAPPTFLASAALWAGPDAVPPGLVRNWSRILHGEQEYVFHGPPPRAGQRLTARQHIADSYTKQGRRGGEMRFTVLVTEFHDEDGTLVAEARSTVIETSRAAGEES